MEEERGSGEDGRKLSHSICGKKKPTKRGAEAPELRLRGMRGGVAQGDGQDRNLNSEKHRIMYR